MQIYNYVCLKTGDIGYGLILENHTIALYPYILIASLPDILIQCSLLNAQCWDAPFNPLNPLNRLNPLLTLRARKCPDPWAAWGEKGSNGSNGTGGEGEGEQEEKGALLPRRKLLPQLWAESGRNGPTQ